MIVVQFLSEVWLCNPMDCSTLRPPVLHYLPEHAQTHVHWVSDAIHLIFCRPLLLLLSVFPSIRVFSNESALLIRWPKYWSFSFKISTLNEYLGLISIRTECFDLLAVQGTLKSLYNTTVQKHQCFSAQPSLGSNSHIHTSLLKKLYFDWMDICR